jgi:hypothetical protein
VNRVSVSSTPLRSTDRWPFVVGPLSLLRVGKSGEGVAPGDYASIMSSRLCPHCNVMSHFTRKWTEQYYPPLADPGSSGMHTIL